MLISEKCPAFAKRYCFRATDDHGSGDNFSTGSHVELLGVDPLVVQEFLRYIYIGTVEQMQFVGFSLYELALNYEVNDLMELCIDHMAEHMTSANALNMYVFAKAFNIPRLVTRASEVFHW